MNVSVYVAARFQHQARARELAAALEVEGATITSSWLRATERSDGDLTHYQRAQRATTELGELARSDVLVLMNPPESATVGAGGCHVETGYALATWKPILVVGCLSNIFHCLDQVALVAGPRSAMATARNLLELQQRRLLDAGRRWGRGESGRFLSWRPGPP